MIGEKVNLQEKQKIGKRIIQDLVIITNNNTLYLTNLLEVFFLKSMFSIRKFRIKKMLTWMPMII